MDTSKSKHWPAGRPRGGAVFLETRRYQIGFLGAVLEFHHRNVRGEKCAFLIGQSSASWLRASRVKQKCRTADGKVPVGKYPNRHERWKLRRRRRDCFLNSGVTDGRYLAVSRSSRSGPLKKNATTSLAVASPPHFLAASRGVSLAGWESPPGETRARVSSARARRPRARTSRRRAGPVGW